MILGVKLILEEQGYKVYVDWVDDPGLSRDKVNKDTAALLRERMKQSKSLIFVATENASSSKWMPWELGFFDGYKPKRVSVMPVLDSAYESFSGQEYLGLYPIVNKNSFKNDSREVLFVENKGSEWITLDDFVKEGTSWKNYS